MATKDGNKENQACNRGDIKATREGEETPELDLGDRGEIKATREGKNKPELDLVDRGDGEVTREGEETPELGLRNHENNEATRWIKPVINKEEESPARWETPGRKRGRRD